MRRSGLRMELDPAQDQEIATLRERATSALRKAGRRKAFLVGVMAFWGCFPNAPLCFFFKKQKGCFQGISCQLVLRRQTSSVLLKFRACSGALVSQQMGCRLDPPFTILSKESGLGGYCSIVIQGP